MIYVYISPDFATYENKDNYTFRTILKIGYSKDETLSTRGNAYKTENPSRRLLYTIPDGSLQDETNIHKKFKHLIVYGNEWFENSEEIHEFFKTHTTKESLRYLSNLDSIKKTRTNNKTVGSLFRTYEYTLHRFFVAFSNIFEFKDNSVIQYILEVDKEFSDVEKCLVDWICINYPDYASVFIYEYDSLILFERKYQDIIDEYRDIDSRTISERLRSFCEDARLSKLDKDKKIIAQLISEKFDQYYNLVGPDRCRALGYNVTYIRQEAANKKVSSERIRENFLNYFSVGDKIPRSKVKELTSNIYQSLGITKKAKATDLSEYFETKSIKTKAEDGSWVNSIEILSVK